MAQAGGVLNRAGHTEAGCDLAKLAGLEPAAVIVEILNEDGSMARRPDLEVFAKQHKLKMGTIADLIHYRIQHENTLERISECEYPTEFGDFKLYAYQDRNDDNIHLALVMGDVAGEEPILVRVHARNLLDDLFSSTRPESSITIRFAMKKIAEEGRGVLVVIRQNENNKSLAEHIHHYHMLDNGTVEDGQIARKVDWRTTGTGGRVLADLGVHRLKVMGAEKKYFGLSGYNLEVVEHTE
jgi:3,4-dihydroxy 2-butanone 4-phosphate synthase/GTP cyclohydrolase II